MGRMKLGVMVPMNRNIGNELRKLKELGFETCQLVCWDRSLFTGEFADEVNKALKEYDAEVTAFWCGWPGPAEWNFFRGHTSLGLVPPEYRFERMQALIAGSDFAKKIGVRDVATHVGFIPENPYDPNYSGVVQAVKYVAEHCKRNGQYFLFETGQETPVTLKRIMQDIGLDNLGVNIDPANLLMYGKANPVDALDILGPYVRGVHAKDGEYPTDGRYLGQEKPLGEGRVNFPAFIRKLAEFGYEGALTIEREIHGDQQIKDILKGKEFLEGILESLS